jgi:FkbM family methyltransferase
MRRILSRIRGVQWRIRALWRIVPLADAMKVVLSRKKEGEVRIYLRPIGRHIVLRRRTTDLQCFEKVFLADEYRSPFVISPNLIIDAGANIGMATLYFAHRYPGAHVVAIEPEPRNFEMLKRNCEGLTNITLMKAALWSEVCELRIANREAEEWAFSVTAQCRQSRSSDTVPGITIDRILHHRRADRVDLLKIDIEGSELKLFSSGAAKWLDHVGVIVIELHDRFFPGCARAFYSALISQRFVQELRGENIFVQIAHDICDKEALRAAVTLSSRL